MTFSHDYCFNGELKICQPKRGYRFSVDSVLLGRWVKPHQKARILDLGCGCGIMALMLAYLYPQTRVTGVEIQAVLAEAARLNVSDNGLLNLNIIEGDACLLKPNAMGAPFDMIVCNPPFFKANAGKVNLNQGAAAARHEITLNLPLLAQTARRLLTTKGKLSLIYPAARLGELMTVLPASGFMPKRLRCVHSHVGDPACLVLLESNFGGSHGLKIEPPLYIYKNESDYSDEGSL